MFTLKVKRAYRRIALLTITAITLTGPAGAHAATPPVKLVPSSHITSGFEYPESVAVNEDPASPSYGNIYVADRGHSRVQELTPSGEFVLMFGGDVNKTKTEANAPQPERNVCTAASHDTCQGGATGTAAGQFALVHGLAVDPSSGDVYVQETGEANQRIDKYTASGEFVWMAGREVNQTEDAKPGANQAMKNLCTAESGDLCGAGAQRATGSTEHDAFNFLTQHGDLLAVGPNDTLYAGEEQRVQELNAKGEWQGEIPPATIDTGPECSVSKESCLILALTVDAAGNVYLADEHARVREFDAEGKEVNSFDLSPKQQGAEAIVEGIALDSSGRLAVAVFESGISSSSYGLLYTASGHLITEFTIPQGGSNGLAFGGGGELYAVTGSEVAVYTPENVAELLPDPATCVPGAGVESSATLDCALNGTANPEGVSETVAWFEWGDTQTLGQRTAVQEVNALGPFSAAIGGLRPDETFYYRLAGEDHNVKAPEGLTSETASFTTPVVAPVIVGAPSVSFVTPSSAVMFAELNPENTTTTYRFEYGVCEDLESCPTLQSTPTIESGAYGKIGSTQEASALQPGTTYHYRLLASNEHLVAGAPVGGQVASPPGTFTTGPAPFPQAATGSASSIGASTATISGTVNADGQPAAYSFELGVDAGALTSYGVVSSGAAGRGTAPIEETQGLSGLQPGTTYAYRIVVHSGYGTTTGQSATFTTAGVPAVLGAPGELAQLAVPNAAFPKVTGSGSRPKRKAKGKQKRKAKKQRKAEKQRNGSKRKARKGKK